MRAKQVGTVGAGLLACWVGMKLLDSPNPIATAAPSELRLDTVFHVIRQVETGGHPDPANAIGDQGRSLGPYQISRAYFQDAVDHDPSLYGLEYDGVRDQRMSEIIMLAYFERWVPTPWTFESLARTHNGGPRGRFKDSTLPYWRKCQEMIPRP